MAKEVKNKAMSIHAVLAYKPVLMDFDGEFEALMGKPERQGTWIIWGNSGNGKTRFALQLAKYLTRFGRVAYNSLEEGLSLSMRKAITELGLRECNGKLLFIDKEDITELQTRLSRPKSPEIIIIDSLQYTGLDYRAYKSLKNEFYRKLFIFISHADGKDPAGRTAKSIRFDANVKIYVEGFRAFAVSRYGGGHPYTIWDIGAQKYYGG